MTPNFFLTITIFIEVIEDENALGVIPNCCERNSDIGANELHSNQLMFSVLN